VFLVHKIDFQKFFLIKCQQKLLGYKTVKFFIHILSKKKISDIFDCNLKKDYPILVSLIFTSGDFYLISSRSIAVHFISVVLNTP